MSKTGKVYLIGAGPGDAGLITVKGLQLLQQADVVVCDALVVDELLNQIKAGCEVIDAGKRSGHHRLQQEKIHQLLIHHAKRGKQVARLQGGDPMLFGRGGEEMQALKQARVPYEVVPGVSSVTAVAAAAGIPVTHRDYNSSVTILTGHGESQNKTLVAASQDWATLAKQDTLVMVMGFRSLELNMHALMAHGMSASIPVAVVQWGTLPQQRTITGTVGTIAKQVEAEQLWAPVVVIVGKVVKLRQQLQWFEKKALFAKHILVTRARHQSSDLSNQLREAGARVSEIPTVEIGPPRSFKKLDQALSEICAFEWILFTSVNGVEAFFERLHSKKLDSRALANAKIAVIGPMTGERLAKFGLMPDVVAADYRAEGLLKKLPARLVKHKQILIARAQSAREILPQTLKERGAIVVVAPVYQTVAPASSRQELVELLKQDLPELLTFASSSMVENLVKLLARSPKLLKQVQKIPAACIGPITAQSAKRLGFKVAVQPKQYTIAALVKAIKKIK